MATITQVAQTLQKVFGEQVEVLARDTGFIQRQVTVTGRGFVQAMLLSVQGKRSPSYSEISQSASSLGMPMSAQGMEQRLNERCAQFMKAVLEMALKEKVSGIAKSAFPVLEKFNGVHLRDSTTIGLPASLKDVWRGTGNQNAETAALKLQVSWEYSRGALDGIALQDGCCQDQTSPYQRLDLPAGALHLGDLGYFSLEKLAHDSEQGVFWITRWKFRTTIWETPEHLLDLVPFLSKQTESQLDLPVHVGGKRQLACRLLASRVPQEVADQRRQRIHDTYRKHGRQPSEKMLHLAEWTLVLTNVPVTLLSLPEALLLLRVRWQIELLFKLWKQYLAMDKCNSQNPWRILTEMYAKLLTALLFHWTTLVDFWRYPDRSLFKAVKVFQQYLMLILFQLVTLPALLTSLQRLLHCYTHSCRIRKHSQLASTYQRLLDPSLC
ncbi:MAG TPA: IS4 family transposase [Anaerolineales bacterium]|nr:IS4 family transposase [Anaerolineales bacterium]